jgi:transcription antitermination factor NusG
LNQLSTINERNTEREYFDAAAEVSDTTRDLEVGDRVRIVNPGRFQAKKGVIFKITENRITVQAQNGTKIQRAHHNIVLDN